MSKYTTHKLGHATSISLHHIRDQKPTWKHCSKENHSRKQNHTKLTAKLLESVKAPELNKFPTECFSGSLAGRMLAWHPIFWQSSNQTARPVSENATMPSQYHYTSGSGMTPTNEYWNQYWIHCSVTAKQNVNMLFIIKYNR